MDLYGIQKKQAKNAPKREKCAKNPFKGSNT